MENKTQLTISEIAEMISKGIEPPGIQKIDDNPENNINAYPKFDQSLHKNVNLINNIIIIFFR